MSLREEIFVVSRQGENRVATVKAWVSFDREQMMSRLVDVLTKWANTPAGRAAWKNSSCDFNVGDLSQYQNDTTLRPYLNDEGIWDLTVDIENERRLEPNWVFDDVLMDALLIEDED